jgi:predicted nucleic acid-binding protein
VKKIFFDTSAYVKIFSQEPGTQEAKQLMDLAHEGRIQILLSVWAINEAIAAIDKKCFQRKEISANERDIIIATILKQSIEWTDPSYNVHFVPLDAAIVSGSVELIYKLHISANDALHLYTAFAMECEALICKDDPLKKNADYKLENLRILDITTHAEMNPLFRSIEK